ncbi:MAG: ComEC/Rec2 family competence protein [Endomicrobiia bacterium]|nr:ComEC/Rec2 family competence protein [Endomicrobiaceae bacterium]MDD3053050.1 ComEC/Rec2 family competence protein [Endomicrobiaceae bacterium]MDD3922187.1 ComEC/Rec2 family competence protein [Endomicrobiaceae bacterium]
MLFKRPIITILFIYIATIIVLNYLGIFSADNQSFLIYNISQKKVILTGKVLEQPIIKANNQQFVLEVNNINDTIIKEKTLVYAPLAYNIEYGDIICISGKLSNIEKPNFPYNFDYNLYLQRQNIYTKFYLYNFELIDKHPNKIKLIALKVNKDIEKKLVSYFKQPYSLVLQSMFIGNQYFSDKETKNDFVNTGLIHILVVSGWHIGFCIVIIIFILKLFSLPLKYIYTLTIPIIFFYTLMTGANPPAVRAAIMATCMLLSLLLDREPLIYNAIALSALIIFIFNPQTLFTASFQLSFLATLGIIYLYPKINNIFGNIKNKIYKFIWEIISVTLSAQIALIPLLIFYFGQLSTISFIVNILIVPVVGFIVGLSFLFYITTFISSYIALSISIVLSFILNVVLGIIHFFANLQFSMIDVKIPTIIEIFFYYFAIIIMIEFRKNKIMLSILAFIIVLILCIPLQKQEFYKTFTNNKNITIHIKDKKDGNIIVFDEIKKDRYYFINLEQYLLSQGINKIDKFYLNNPINIQNKLSKITIIEVCDIKDFINLKNQ